MYATLLVLMCLVAFAQAANNYYFLESTDCDSITSQSTCDSNGCSWCVSGAVGASCNSAEDAAALPASIFTCDAPSKKVAAVTAVVKDNYYFLTATDCDSISDQKTCAKNGCVYCESGAVGGSCNTEEEAASLPASIFSCDSAKVETVKVVAPESAVAEGNYYFMSSTDCDAIKDEGKCASAGCSWCTSGAVGASCNSAEDAAALPASIFTCDAPKVALTLSGSGLGLDISQPLSSSTAGCFASGGATYVIPRGYKSSGAVDSNTCASLNAAKSAGIAHRETYMFPCPTCSKSASQQVSELASSMKSCGAFTGRIWLDIEGSQYWTGNASNNKAWYQSLVDACKSSGFSCGVYTNANNWSTIFGSTSYSYGASLPLWYAHYDNSPSFSDFKSFGGWSKPYAKQYQGDTTMCSMGVDKNYSPNF